MTAAPCCWYSPAQPIRPVEGKEKKIFERRLLPGVPNDLVSVLFSQSIVFGRCELFFGNVSSQPACQQVKNGTDPSRK